MEQSPTTDRLSQELRLAQLENKLLREQLLKSLEETQRTREEMQKLTARLDQFIPAAKVEASSISPNDRQELNGSANSQPAAGKAQVLYVEDNVPNFELVENILKDRPEIDLLWAETGEKGLLLAREHKPRLILLDLDLPDIHGSVVLERLHADPSTAQLPVVVISADATPSRIEKMLSAGARNYLTKPFDIRRFLYIVDDVVAH